MHLGVNLRKAFVQAISPTDTDSSHQYTAIDSFVHAFAKEFGAHGTPEYGAGAIKFPDFLEIQCRNTERNEYMYFKQCTDIHLERQVGSRYFVTAVNASKALFLATAAVEYLKSFTAGNRLERDLLVQLQDPDLLAQLKTDAIMFYFVYADLTNLAKNKCLNKSAYSMGQHYLELKVYLEEIEKYPEIAFDKEHVVFPSEERLYSDPKVCWNRDRPVWNRLFLKDDFDSTVLLKLSAGATAMRAKLEEYASSQLPGGEYWDPDTRVKLVLLAISPTNDFCESILGLNDYLTTAIPNMDQLTKSAMVTAKKNKTVQWLKALPEGHQNDLTLCAMRRKQAVAKTYRQEQCEVKQRRQEAMIQAKQRRELLEKKAADEREALTKVHIITSVTELEQVIADIDASDGSVAGKNNKKLAEQVRVRKKILNQKVPITFTRSKKKRPVTELINEVKAFIASAPSINGSQVKDSLVPVHNTLDPWSLVGRHVYHRFIDSESSEKWYEGYVLAYNPVLKVHEIAYVEEENHFFFIC